MPKPMRAFRLALSAVALGVVAQAAVGCHRGSGTHTPEPGRPPERLAAHFFICPPGYDFAVYGSVFYPPNYPGFSVLTRRPGRCFSTAQEASRAGYRLAPPPPGAMVVRSVYLVPPDEALPSYCGRAAHLLGRTVLCPTLVPGEPDSMDGCSTVPLRQCLVGGRFLIDGHFTGPPGYRGVTEGGGHINIWSGSARLLRQGYFGCPWGHESGPADATGRRGVWIVCPEGSSLDSGHVILQWRSGGLVYGVSLHGHSAVNRSLAMVIAEHLRPVAP